MKLKVLTVMLVLLSAIGWAGDWRAMRDEADLPAPQQAGRNPAAECEVVSGTAGPAPDVAG